MDSQENTQEVRRQTQQATTLEVWVDSTLESIRQPVESNSTRETPGYP